MAVTEGSSLLKDLILPAPNTDGDGTWNPVLMIADTYVNRNIYLFSSKGDGASPLVCSLRKEEAIKSPMERRVDTETTGCGARTLV